MGFYSRNNEEQSRLTDEVYAAIQRCKGMVLGDGHLSAETKQEPRSIYAALELLEEEGKITIAVTRNAREECKGS
jgi:hypothetical protein